MVWERLCALLGQGCSPAACTSMTPSAGTGVCAGKVWKTRTIPVHWTSLLLSTWWVLTQWTSTSQGTVADKHLHGFEKFLGNSLKINLSWTIIHSGGTGFALGWPCSVMSRALPMALLCSWWCSLVPRASLRKFGCCPAASCLRAGLGFAQVCLQRRSVKGSDICSVVCDRQVWGDASVTDWEIRGL